MDTRGIFNIDEEMFQVNEAYSQYLKNQIAKLRNSLDIANVQNNKFQDKSLTSLTNRSNRHKNHILFMPYSRTRNNIKPSIEVKTEPDSDAESVVSSVVSVSSTEETDDFNSRSNASRIISLSKRIANAGDPYHTPSHSPVGVVRPVPSPCLSFGHQEQGHIANHQLDGPSTSGRIVPTLRYYGSNSSNQHGCGFVLILANFTDDLVGYKSDIQATTNFFTDKLSYDVYGGSKTSNNELPLYRNLSREGMLNILTRVQHYLNSPFPQKKYDRLFVFILSHGDEHGIKTCQQLASGRTVEEGAAFGRPSRVKPDEVTRMFYHDKVPSLREQPRCFYIQTCQGTTRLQAANDSYTGATVGPLAVGADTALFYASTFGHPSYVHPSQGSWFIQTAVAALTKHYQHHHLLDIMTEVVDVISQKCGETDNSGNQLCQLPTIVSNLRRRFFLTVPE